MITMKSNMHADPYSSGEEILHFYFMRLLYDLENKLNNQHLSKWRKRERKRSTRGGK